MDTCGDFLGAPICPVGVRRCYDVLVVLAERDGVRDDVGLDRPGGTGAREQGAQLGPALVDTPAAGQSVLQRRPKVRLCAGAGLGRARCRHTGGQSRLANNVGGVQSVVTTTASTILANVVTTGS